MSKQNPYQASCFCGEVQFTLHQAPEGQGICHCNSCRSWSAGPINTFTLWKPENIEITSGEDKIEAYAGNPISDHQETVSIRKWCKSCGGHVFIEHPTMGVVDIPAVVIKNFNHDPGLHVHYQETVHQIKDGLPKFKDLPEPFGGSGEQLPEEL